MKTCVSRPDASVDLRGCVCGHAAPFRPRAQADLVGKRPTFHSNLFFFFFLAFFCPDDFRRRERKPLLRQQGGPSEKMMLKRGDCRVTQRQQRWGTS